MNNLAYSTMSYQTHVSATSSSKDEMKAIKASALRLLARREYSRLELYRKLSQKYASGTNIQLVLDQLKEQGYQSDDRFTEMFIRSKVHAGNGPFKIKIELREKGICESTVLSAFDRQSIDWYQIAKEVNRKRFGDYFSQECADQYSLTENTEYGHAFTESASKEQDHKQQLAKQIRYLKNKGFYQEHIEQVLKA